MYYPVYKQSCQHQLWLPHSYDVGGGTGIPLDTRALARVVVHTYLGAPVLT